MSFREERRPCFLVSPVLLQVVNNLWKHSVTELETPNNMAAAHPGMALQPLYNSGADPGFWERGGLINIFTTGGGPVTARGSGGALIAP